MKTLSYNFLKIAGIFLLLFVFAASHAQVVNFMVLSKPGKGKRYTFYEGQEVTYMLKNDIGFYTDKIVKIKDSVIEFSTYNVEYNRIDKILIPKKKHIIPNKMVLTYGVNILGGAILLNLAYLVNSGAGMSNIIPTTLALLTPVPLFLLVNWVYGLFIKTEYTLSPTQYQLRPVVLRKD